MLWNKKGRTCGVLIVLLISFSNSVAFEAKTDSVYIVKEGESLWSISHKLFGDGRMAYDLWYYRLSNRVGNPNLIYPGEALVIPQSNINQDSAIFLLFKTYQERQDSIQAALERLEKTSLEISEGSFYKSAPFSLIDVCIAFLAAILGISFPVFNQISSKVNEKYKSDRIYKSFKDNHITKTFKRLLILNLGLCGVVVLLKYSGLVNHPILIYALTILLALLIIYLFRQASLIQKYSVPKSLFYYLKEKHERS